NGSTLIDERLEVPPVLQRRIDWLHSFDEKRTVLVPLLAIGTEALENLKRAITFADPQRLGRHGFAAKVQVNDYGSAIYRIWKSRTPAGARRCGFRPRVRRTYPRSTRDHTSSARRPGSPRPGGDRHRKDCCLRAADAAADR